MAIGIAVLVPLSLAVVKPHLAQAERLDNPAIHFVVDVSGSIAEERLTSAVAAIKQSAAAVPDTTALGLRSYEGGCDQIAVSYTHLTLPTICSV